MPQDNPGIPLSYKDVTIKACINDFARIEEMLITLGAVYIGHDAQTDYYFETANGKLKLRQGIIENVIIHYRRDETDGVEKTTVFRYEENPTADQVNQLKKENKLLGVIKKSRKIYRAGKLKIHLDTMPGGQHFIEIEAIDVTNRVTEEEIKNQCLELKQKLGIPDSHLVKTGYLQEMVFPQKLRS